MHVKMLKSYLDQEKKKEYCREMKRRKKLLKNIKNRRSGELPVEKEQKEIDNLDQKLSGINHDIVFSEQLDRNITMWKNFEQKQLFYYSYELDFRMRIYPHSPHAHPMGNMLSRAVVQLTEKYQMDIEAFKITATKNFLKCIGLNIAEILAIYNAFIISYLQSFRKKEVLAVIYEKAENSFGFLSQYFIYEEWSKNEFTTAFKVSNILELFCF